MLGSNEAKVRVRLDTSQAKSELADLTRRGAAVAGRLGSGLRSVAGAAIGGAGIGVGAVGAALSAPTLGGVGDVLGDALGPWANKLRNTLLGGKTASARAAAAAREQTINTFGTMVGIQGRGPALDSAHSFYQQIYRLRLQAEEGRQIIEEDIRFRGEAGRKLAEKFSDTLNRFMDVIANKGTWWSPAAPAHLYGK